MHDETAEKAKARRDLRIIVICAIVGVALPVLIFCVKHLGKAS
jgi:hypothetical protein